MIFSNLAPSAIYGRATRLRMSPKTMKWATGHRASLRPEIDAIPGAGPGAGVSCTVERERVVALRAQLRRVEDFILALNDMAFTTPKS
jgi:hypothetical protein